MYRKDSQIDTGLLNTDTFSRSEAIPMRQPDGGCTRLGFSLYLFLFANRFFAVFGGQFGAYIFKRKV